MADQIALLTEAHNRGILPPDKEALYQEAVRRGLIQNTQQSANTAKVASMVKDAQTPSFGESLAVPVGAALSDTGRAIEHLINLGTNDAGMQVAASQNAADEANIDRQEQPARDAAAEANPHSYYGLYAPAMVLSQSPLGEGVGGAAARGVEASIPSTEAAIAAATAAGKVIPAGAAAGRNLLPRTLAAVGRSAPVGAAYGAQMPGDTLTNIATGATLGPLSEGGIGALKLGAAVTKKTGGGMMELLRQMANPETEAQNTVNKILQESATGSPTLQPSPVPGVNLSAGGQSLDSGLQDLEQVVRSRNVGGQSIEALATAVQRKNNAVIRGRFGQIGATDAPLADSSTAAHDALTGAQDARAAQEKELWKQVPMDTPVDAAKTSAAIDGFINKQSVTNQGVIRRAAGDFLNDFKATVAKYASEGEDGTQVKMPFGEIKDLRSTLGQSIRDAQKSGNSNAVRLLKGLDDRLLSNLGDENALLGVPEPSGSAALDSANAKLGKINGTVTAQDLGDSYNAARKFTADTHGTYITKPVQGFLDTTPSKMLDSVTKSPENVKAFLNAAGQHADGGASATKALRDYYVSKAIQVSNLSARGGNIKTPYIDGQKLAKWLQANNGQLAQVFSGDEIQQMHQLSEAAYRNIATEAATPRVGSNTLQKFMGSQNLPSAPGKMGAVANTLRDALVGKYRGQTETLLRDTLMDPQNKGLQEILDQPQTPSSIAQLKAYLSSAKGKIPAWLKPIILNRVAGSSALHAPQALATRFEAYQHRQH